jgi:hypothetical protein
MGAPVGNQNAAKAKVWRAAIDRALERRTQSRTDGIKEIDALADTLLQLVATGDLPALKEFGDRMDGKPAQALIGGDDDDPPLKVEGIVKLVRPANGPKGGADGQ